PTYATKSLPRPEATPAMSDIGPADIPQPPSTVATNLPKAAIKVATGKALFDAFKKDLDDCRRHRRSAFQGTAVATIYPIDWNNDLDVEQCIVTTRDLSCSGIGIAHKEPLYPTQIVVLNAVGKLLVGEIRWCRQVDENLYIAGCRLVKTTESNL